MPRSSKSNKVKIVVDANDVSAIIGESHFSSGKTALLKIWKSIDPNGLEDAKGKFERNTLLAAPSLAAPSTSSLPPLPSKLVNPSTTRIPSKGRKNRSSTLNKEMKFEVALQPLLKTQSMFEMFDTFLVYLFKVSVCFGIVCIWNINAGRGGGAYYLLNETFQNTTYMLNAPPSVKYDFSSDEASSRFFTSLLVMLPFYVYFLIEFLNFFSSPSHLMVETCEVLDSSSVDDDDDGNGSESESELSSETDTGESSDDDGYDSDNDDNDDSDYDEDDSETESEGDDDDDDSDCNTSDEESSSSSSSSSSEEDDDSIIKMEYTSRASRPYRLIIKNNSESFKVQKGVLTESKTRKNKFYNSLFYAEHIKTLLCIGIINKIDFTTEEKEEKELDYPFCKVVEKFKNQKAVHTVKFDLKMYNEILARLFVEIDNVYGAAVNKSPKNQHNILSKSL